ncbi:MAG TPA: glucose 1-dehydrogenase [Candidatus Nanopelagicaceae bacterium]|nr:glucose 1-dehydrogenase [Candidatus Nanopelagicaceae bacterium]
MGLIERFRLDGRVAIVTGASSGLGVGFAETLAEAGADLVLGARRIEKVEEVAQRVRALGREAIAIQIDVADPLQCSALVAAGVAKFGHVDVLVNNAGVGTAVPALKESPLDYSRVIDVNLKGAYWMAKAFASSAPSGSSIINIASILGFRPLGLPQAAYVSSKAGLIGLTKDLAAQWSGRKGIRVNALAPGYFESEMTDQLGAEILESVTSGAPIGRIGRPEEINAALLFLASDASSYCTGIVLPVDGGISMH